MSRLRPGIHPLLSEDVVEALQGKQVWTVVGFVKMDAQQITKFARLNFREVLAVKNFLRRKFSAAPVNGFDLYKNTLKNTAIVPTGIEGVDNLLNGGLFTGNIYELCGLPASGKSYFALNLTKNLVLNTSQKVCIIDTKGDFSATKMKSMLKKYDETKQTACLKDIIVYRSYTKYDLINTLYEIKDKIEGNMQVRLIIIDSLPAVLLNTSDQKTNGAYINHLANIMRYISTEHHVAFLVINLVTTWSDFNTQQNPLENISCGRYWFNVPNTRLKIEKTDDLSELCKIFVLGSNTLKFNADTCAEVFFTNEGLV